MTERVTKGSEPFSRPATVPGVRPGKLIAVSPADGSKLTDYRLQDPPVFDGMAAAGARLYLTTTGGKVLCFGRK